MFTGLIKALGHLNARSSRGAWGELTISCPTDILPQGQALNLGASIAVNGVCLTVTKGWIRGREYFFTATVMEETWRVTTLSLLPLGSPVNLEPALRLGDSLDGHLVSGDVDDIGQVLGLESRIASRVYTIKPKNLGTLDWIVLRGRIAIDGASLTVMEVDRETFSVSLIPHTMERITLGRSSLGDWCNLETDLLARHFTKARGIA